MMAALVQSMTSEKGSSQRGLRSTGMQPAWGAGQSLGSPALAHIHHHPRPPSAPLKGLEKAGGGRSVTRDEAEGGIGKGLSWVGLLGSRVLLTVPVPEAG